MNIFLQLIFKLLQKSVIYIDIYLIALG